MGALVGLSVGGGAGGGGGFQWCQAWAEGTKAIANQIEGAVVLNCDTMQRRERQRHEDRGRSVKALMRGDLDGRHKRARVKESLSLKSQATQSTIGRS